MTPLFLPSTPVRESSYPGLNQCSFILPAGFRQEEGRMATTCPILVEQDIPVRLRDGVTIRVDIFRPAGTERVPVIMGWSSYGKRASWLTLDLFGHPTRMDVKKEWEDGLNKFEGPNPAYWVAHGYAVAAPDPRGVFMSEGDIQAWGPQEARDEYDVIEWLAARPWCNGKIGLSGTSMLAMTQYFVAALRPPHLAAIAPCEGASDLYKDNLARGGIPANLFASQIFSHVYGNGRTEDLAGMIAREPLYNEYWASKAAELERIITPAYIVASWTNLVHTGGTFRAWERISSAEKWLRVHNTHEWHEYYRPDHVEELRRFFDYYLKGRENGWPDTPRVRLAVLNPGHEDILDRKESEFPLNREKYRLFHLGEQEKLSESPSNTASRCVMFRKRKAPCSAWSAGRTWKSPATSCSGSGWRRKAPTTWTFSPLCASATVKAACCSAGWSQGAPLPEPTGACAFPCGRAEKWRRTGPNPSSARKKSSAPEKSFPWTSASGPRPCAGTGEKFWNLSSAGTTCSYGPSFPICPRKKPSTGAPMCCIWAGTSTPSSLCPV